MSNPNLKLKVIMLRFYAAGAIASFLYCIYLISEGGTSYIRNPISYAGGAIAMGIIGCMCLHLFHNTLFKSDK